MTIQQLQEQLFKLQNTLRMLQNTPRIKLWNAARAAVGTDVTPDDRVPDDVACAVTVSALMAKVRPFPMISGTYTMYTYLRPKYDIATTPLPGDIIISPTGMASKKVISNGHVGVVGVGGIIYSNNSRTGKLDTHWTIASWREYYEKKGGYPVYFFRIT